jgi:hypothetical protein
MPLSISALAKSVLRRFTKKPTQQARGANRFRPVLERCEDRSVPSVEGTIFYDLNRNYVQDAGEPGVGGVEVTLYNGGNMVGPNFSSNTGYYFPETPVPGDLVHGDLSSDHGYGYANTWADASSGYADMAVQATGNQIGGQGTIAGKLWFDTNGNGVRDTGEDDGPDGVSVELYYEDGLPYNSYSVGTAYTVNGEYSFGGLWAGEGYSIRISSLPAGCELVVAGDTEAEAPVTGTSTYDLGVKLPVVTVAKLSDGKEGDHDATLRFTRTGDLSGELTVHILTPTGTATGSGTDYSLMDTSVTFAASSATADLTLTVNDDSDTEPTETVTLTIDEDTNVYRVGAQSSDTLNIYDNDYVTVARLSDATEGAVGKFAFTRQGDTSSSLTVNYTVGGTADAGDDFEALSGTITIGAGQTTAELDVAALDDGLLEGRETVTATVASGTGYTPSETTDSLTIIDKVYGDTFDWNGVATVKVLVTYDAPGHAGEYVWNYHLTNDSFAPGIANFALPAEDSGMVSGLGNSLDWSGSIGTFLSNSDLIAWQTGGSTLGIGNSADFWFTTAPLDLALTNGMISNVGLATTVGGLLVVPTALAAPPQPKPDKILVASEKDGDLNNKLTTLRDAVKTASDAQPAGQSLRIRFTNGMQGKTITLNDAFGTIELENNNIVIDGLGKNVTITRDTTKPDFRLFHVWDTAKITSFIGLTLKNGRATTEAQNKGGAIYAQGDSITLQDCTFSDNKANSGGAVAVIAGTLDIVNCTFSNNEAVTDDGGAIFIGAVTVANISNTDIVGNTAAHDGGGIMVYNTSSTSLTITGSLIQNNSAQNKGAGICIDQDTDNPQVTLTGGTWVVSNTLGGANSKGGGLYLGKGSATLADALFAYNTATLGDGIYGAPGTQVTLGPGGVEMIDDEYYPE